MTVVNLLPLIDSITGTMATPARFHAERRRARRAAMSVTGATVTAPQRLVWVWDGTNWDEPPLLGELPPDEYWWTVLYVGPARLERNVTGVGLGAVDTLDYGALVDVAPDTAAPDALIAQYQGVIQSTSAILASVTAVADQITAHEETLQAQILAAQTALDQANAGLAGIATAQSVTEQAAVTATAAATAAVVDVTAQVAAVTLATLGGITPTDVDTKITAALTAATPTLIDGNL